MKNQKLFTFLMTLVIFLLVIIIAHNFIMLSDVYTRLKNQENTMRQYIDQNDSDIMDEILSIDDIKDYISSIPVAKDGENGVDGSDGANGTNGKDSISTHTIVEKQVPINGTNGVDGSTPFIRCNTEYNAWEVRYSSDDVWKFMNGEIVACTIK